MVFPAVGDRDPEDLRQNTSESTLQVFPSESYIDFLNQIDIQKKISAEVPYFQCSFARAHLFGKTADVCFLSAICIATIQSEFTKYSIPEQCSLNWELSQTPGSRCLFGYEHIRSHSMYT